MGRFCGGLRHSVNRKHKYLTGSVRPVVSHESEEPRRSNTPGSFLGSRFLKRQRSLVFTGAARRRAGDGSRRGSHNLMSFGNHKIWHFQISNPRRAIYMHREMKTPAVGNSCTDAITWSCHQRRQNLSKCSFRHGLGPIAVAAAHTAVLRIGHRPHLVAAIGTNSQNDA